MKKILIILACIVIIGLFGQIFLNNIDTTQKKRNNKEILTQKKENSKSVKKESQKEGFDILLSKKEITLKKGEKTSFEITFTNPDEESIREYIHCNDQDSIILVQYSNIENRKITAQVEGLKTGTTEILVSDYEYPNTKEYVKVHVTN